MKHTPKQCSLCLAYCDAHGRRLHPQPKVGDLLARGVRLGVPEPCVCPACEAMREPEAENHRPAHSCLPPSDR